jgi:tetratricopeptide (TPR) repeat protein
LVILLAFCLGRVANEETKSLEVVSRNLKIILIPAFGLILMFSYYLLKELNAVKKWNNVANETFYSGQINVSPALFNSLKSNPSFLLWYGQSLIYVKPYQAIEILNHLKSYYKRYDLFMYLGSAFEQIRVYDKAIEEFVIASFMIPNRFEPNFRIFKCYKAAGDNASAKKYANKILKMQEKIPSEYIKRIKAEVLLFLNTFP